MAGKKAKSKAGVKKKYQIEMTALSMFLWSFILFFLLAWIFVLGIFVGRGFLPSAVTAISDLKGQINRLQEMVSRDRARDPAAQRKPSHDPELAFYEKLSSKRTEAKKQWDPGKNSEKRPLNGNAPATTGPAAGVQPEAPESTGPETTEKDSVPASPLEERFTVQLASVTDKGKAEEMIDGLIARGYDAYYYETRVKGKIYYRVRCGRFINREEAGRHAEVIAKEAGIKGFVSRLE